MGQLYTAIWVLLGVALTIIVVRPAYQAFAPKVQLPPTGELVGIVTFLLMLAPLSALLISIFLAPILLALGWLVARVAPSFGAAVAQSVGALPLWVSALSLFLVVYLAVFINGVVGYMRVHKASNA